MPATFDAEVGEVMIRPGLRLGLTAEAPEPDSGRQ